MPLADRDARAGSSSQPAVRAPANHRRDPHVSSHRRRHRRARRRRTDAGLIADSGRAQDQGRTYTITYGKGFGSANDIAPKGLGRGKGSLGDVFHNSAAIRRDDGARGRIQSSFIVSEKKVRLDRATGQITGVYRFDDGALFIEADATFDDSDTDRGAIVGGTGAYANARGTVDVRQDARRRCTCCPRSERIARW